MCVCVPYSEVKSEIQQQLKRAALIPILGSGFTRGCTSRKGTVPSGDDYKEYMIDQIIKTRGYDDSKRLNYEKKQFSDISTIYHEIVPKEDQRDYLRNNFTKVEVSSEKKKFLKINWPYVYTLILMMQLKTIVDILLLFILTEKYCMRFFRPINVQSNFMVISVIFWYMKTQNVRFLIFHSTSRVWTKTESFWISWNMIMSSWI